MASPNADSSKDAEANNEITKEIVLGEGGKAECCGPPKDEPLFDALLRKAEQRLEPLLTRKERVARSRRVHYREFERLVITGQLEIRMGFTLPLIASRRAAAGGDGSRRRKRAELEPIGSSKRTRFAKEEVGVEECEGYFVPRAQQFQPVMMPSREETIVCRGVGQRDVHVEEKKEAVRIKPEPEVSCEAEVEERGPGADSLVSTEPVVGGLARASANDMDMDSGCVQSDREPAAGSDVTAEDVGAPVCFPDATAVEEGEGKKGGEMVEDKNDPVRLRLRVARGGDAVRAPWRTEEEPEMPLAPGGTNYMYDGLGEVPYVCAECGVRTETSIAMKTHLRSAHDMNFGAIRPWHPGYLCNFSLMHRCGRVFSSLQRLNAHVTEVHRRQKEGEEDVAVVKRADLDTCEYCRLRVGGRAKGAVFGIEKHVQTHRYDGFLEDVNAKRDLQGKRRWSAGCVPMKVKRRGVRKVG